MKKKQLFQYAVILHEFDTVSETSTKVSMSEVYKDSKMIIEPTMILAKDEKDVIFKVTRLIPEEYATNPDNIEILIRNF